MEADESFVTGLNDKSVKLRELCQLSNDSLFLDYRHAVKQLLTSVVREICMLRSVGAGERATAPGHPVAISNGRPYRDLKTPQ